MFVQQNTDQNDGGDSGDPHRGNPRSPWQVGDLWMGPACCCPFARTFLRVSSSLLWGSSACRIVLSNALWHFPTTSIITSRYFRNGAYFYVNTPGKVIYFSSGGEYVDRESSFCVFLCSLPPFTSLQPHTLAQPLERRVIPRCWSAIYENDWLLSRDRLFKLEVLVIFLHIKCWFSCKNSVWVSLVVSQGAFLLHMPALIKTCNNS